jgi:hypothetical protein
VDRKGSPRKPSVAQRIAQRLAAGVTVFDVDPMEGGLSVSQWMQLWQLTHEPNGFGYVRTEWPDGGSLLEQPAIAVEMLALVGVEITKEAGKGCPTTSSN